ncbi:MAG: c-type cytochrome [Bacteroidetes bacterium]|nr:c-type cytochrome [Bacteroidota bacterium]
MKKVFKVLGYLVLFIAVLAGGGLTYLHVAFPKVADAPEITIEHTPERLARGEYLANHVSLCMDCHAIREWDKFTGPPDETTKGSGGEHFNHEMGFPGDVVSRNITPAGLKDWTDGEIYRAITSGVSKDGTPLFDLMPYRHYGKMDQEDVYSIIAYIRNLKPIERENIDRQLDFPLNLVVRTMPQPAEHQSIPDKNDKVAYGEYMINASGCYDCHTKQVKGEFVGEPYAGGMEFYMGNGRILRSANLTPHTATGIGNLGEEDFLNRFRAYRDGYEPATIGPTDFQTPMPWVMYSGMKDEDLSAIYAYLRTVTPVDNKVVKFELEKKPTALK